jgi:hypothetical protein
MTELVEFAKWRSRQQRAIDRGAVISERTRRRAAGETLPYTRHDVQIPSERVRQVLHGFKQAPQAARDVRAAAEAAQQTVQQIDPVRVERIVQSVERTAGHVHGTANAPIANAAADLAGRTPPSLPKGSGKAAVGAAALLGAGGLAAGAARARSKRLLATAAARQQRQKTARTAILGGSILGGGALVGRRPVEKADDERQNRAVTAAGGAGAVVAASQLRPKRDMPLSRRGQKVQRKLARSKKSTVKLSPKDWAAISGGLGNRRENDAYTARLAQAIRSGKVKQGGTTARVYGDTVRTTGGHHRAYAASMLGRKVPVRVTHRTERRAMPLPAFQARRMKRGTIATREALVRNRNMGRRELNRLAASYSPAAERINSNNLLRRTQGRAGLAAGVLGTGALAAASGKALHGEAKSRSRS